MPCKIAIIIRKLQLETQIKHAYLFTLTSTVVLAALVVKYAPRSLNPKLQHTCLTLKAPITTAADDIFFTCFLIFEKISYDILRESSAMKYHAVFVIFENKRLNLKFSSAANYRWVKD